jgi:hypothetical protein
VNTEEFQSVKNARFFAASVGRPTEADKCATAAIGRLPRSAARANADERARRKPTTARRGWRRPPDAGDGSGGGAGVARKRKMHERKTVDMDDSSGWETTRSEGLESPSMGAPRVRRHEAVWCLRSSGRETGNDAAPRFRRRYADADVRETFAAQK